MSIEKKVLAGALAVIVFIALFIAFTGGSPKDGDKASNCWAHAVNGSRHCASVPAPRFGHKH